MNRVADRLQAALRHQAAQGADAAHLADLAVKSWLDVESSLSSLIGRGGVSALFRRSVFLTMDAYPWLETVTAAEARHDGFGSLRTALARQPAPVAEAANGALLLSFCELLSGLIGAPLTEHLLQPAWDVPASGLTDQEHS
jgi:hypothetical protein